MTIDVLENIIAVDSVGGTVVAENDVSFVVSSDAENGTIEVITPESASIAIEEGAGIVVSSAIEIHVVEAGIEGPQGPAGTSVDAVPYTGATQDVDLGVYKLAANGVTVVTDEEAFSVSATYSGTASFLPNTTSLVIDTPSGNDTFGYVGHYTSIADNHDTSGEIEDSNLTGTGYSCYFVRDANSSVNWLDGREELTAYSMYLTRRGSFTGTGHNVDMIGQDITINNEVGYNNASGTFSQKIIGQKMVLQSTGTPTAGTVNKEITGTQYSFSLGDGVSNCTSAIYANYLVSMAGADTMYYLYALPDVPSYLRGSLGLGVEVPTAKLDIEGSTTSKAAIRLRSGTAPSSPNDGDIWFDGTNLKMRIGGVTKTFTMV